MSKVQSKCRTRTPRHRAVGSFGDLKRRKTGATSNHFCEHPVLSFLLPILVKLRCYVLVPILLTLLLLTTTCLSGGTPSEVNQHTKQMTKQPGNNNIAHAIPLAKDEVWVLDVAKRKQASTINVTQYYRHSELKEFKTRLLPLLRNLTNNINDEESPPKLLPEPYIDEVGMRGNGCCRPRKCMLMWDGYARAMATGDILYDVLTNNIPGAAAEVGVWKGGMAAYLQGILMAMQEDQHRDMWLIDSFEGLPSVDSMTSIYDKSNATFNSHVNQTEWAGQLAVGQKLVRRKLKRQGVLESGNVQFLPGFIQDSLPAWNVSTLAFVRIDVDIYSATYDALHFLYPRLSVGGAVLFDDWKYPYSREAILNYRKEHGIRTPIAFLPGCVDLMAYWIKE